MAAKACYSRSTLQEFALGFLEEERSLQIVEHLESCLVCDDTVASFDAASDTLIRGLKTPAQELSFLEIPAYRQAVGRIRQGQGEIPLVDQADAGQQPILGDYRLLEPLGRGGMGTVLQPESILRILASTC